MGDPRRAVRANARLLHARVRPNMRCNGPENKESDWQRLGHSRLAAVAATSYPRRLMLLPWTFTGPFRDERAKQRSSSSCLICVSFATLDRFKRSGTNTHQKRGSAVAGRRIGTAELP